MEFILFVLSADEIQRQYNFCLILYNDNQVNYIHVTVIET